MLKNLTRKPFALFFLAFFCICTAYSPKVFAVADTAMSGNFGKGIAIPFKAEAIPTQISNFNDSTKTYGDADFELGATSNSPSPITYTSSNPTIITVYQSTVNNNWYAKIHSAGSAIITASVAANLIFFAADSSVTITVNKAKLSVSANAQTKVYGSADPNLTIVISGLVNGDDSATVIQGALSRATGQNVGTYTITQNTLTADTNYTIVYTGANLTITKANLSISANAQTKVYGSADPQFTYSVTGLTNNDAQSVITGSISRNAGENVGSYAIVQGNLSAGGNYNIQFTGANLTISKANLNISANAQSKAYGSADPQLTYTATGLVNNDAQSVITGSLTRNVGENVGAYAINQGSIVAGNNYTIVYSGANLTIGKANLNIVANAQTKVYGAADPQLTYNVSGLVNNDALSIVTGSLNRVAGEDVGKYAINLGSLSAGGNYTLVFTSDYLSITQAQQQITWDQVLKVGCGAVMQIKLTASSSSGLPISYTVSDPSVATINGNTLLINKIAQANVIASQPGNNNYMAATDVILPIIPGLDSFVHQKWSDILVFDNSQGQFNAWQWYKNDSPISGDTLQYYQENGSLNGTYYVIATGVNGGKLSTCPITISPSTPLAGSISVSPNPVSRGATFTISNNYSSQALQGAKITITDMLGTQISVINTISASISVQAPGNAGIYIIRLMLANGQSASINLLVE
ncbi:MAG: T9SS type A sorting domain-containing protein [Bacteroidetes bacterium]|nr:T9SS type A sorting domain-containing protein [Bacteroidota bacterium]